MTMNYEDRMAKVMDYIGATLDEKLTLDQLSSVACFSKYHFHRIFTAYTGLSLHQYIRWLRLKRAAHQLIVYKDKSILDIAINAGFDSHAAFTRSFKQTCGISPSEFREQMSWQAWEKPPYCVPKESEKMMDVMIKEMSARRLAMIEHRGDPMKVGESVSKLIHWAQSQTISLKPKPGEAFAFGYDDPQLTAPEQFRMDLAITVPNQIKIEGEVKETKLPAGRYAVAMHKGNRDNIGDTVYGMYRNWLPNSGEEPGELPCIFCYYNFDHEVAETELLTECWILLK